MIACLQPDSRTTHPPVRQAEINYPAASSGVWVYSLRSLKSKTATAINLIRQIGFNRSKPCWY